MPRATRTRKGNKPPLEVANTDKRAPSSTSPHTNPNRAPTQTARKRVGTPANTRQRKVALNRDQARADRLLRNQHATKPKTDGQHNTHRAAGRVAADITRTTRSLCADEYALQKPRATDNLTRTRTKQNRLGAPTTATADR